MDIVPASGSLTQLASSQWLGHLTKSCFAPLLEILESDVIVWSYSGGQPLRGPTFPLKKCQMFFNVTNIFYVADKNFKSSKFEDKKDFEIC